MGFLAAINALFFFFTYGKKLKKPLTKEMAFMSSMTGIYGIGIFVTVPPF